MEIDTKNLVSLLQAAMSADYTQVRRMANVLSKRLLDAKDVDGAKAIQAVVRKKGVPLQSSGYVETLPLDAGSRLPLLEEGSAPTTPLIIDESAGHVVAQFIEDSRHHDQLEQAGVDAPIRLLIFGDPGTGKSLLASHIAAQLGRPLYIARLDALISSRLGETAKNVRGIFDFIPVRNAVLFLDEMDAIAKLRDDRQELGELKRVVNAVLQGLDTLTNDVIVIGATNHPHLLDPAIFRRFPYKLELRPPSKDTRAEMWTTFLRLHADDTADAKTLAQLSEGLTGADIENISLSARRRAVLDKTDLNLPNILLAILSSHRGSPSLLDSRKLTSDDKRELAVTLHDRARLPVTDIARLIGVSRQMAHRYLKGEDGEIDG
ncbi:ATP-binding protein [Mesorhizobium sp. B2-3-12]|uniref:AAA family ATPase n=1 Tax=Mesorhizobium sp. B2-3-12 TaxID=2589952 RepID=UPI00112B9EC4|nr:ATP-binding protein [Mesorhizobium sp. B2-3-12]TPL88554.1 AAA family ATPase [Mesorhizobium sp. B2-3-12]